MLSTRLQQYPLTGTVVPCLEANTSMTVRIMPCIVVIGPLALAVILRVLLETGVSGCIPIDAFQSAW